jgi:hypothetical protein
VKRQFLIKLIIFFLVLILIDRVYYYSLFEKDLAAKSPELVLIRDTCENSDVFYFGESSNDTYYPDDSTRYSISTLISQLFPSLRFTTVNRNASHAGIYRAWLSQIEKARRLPRSLIVTMNLRSFDAMWIHSKLETPLREGLVLGDPFPPLVNRFRLSLQAYDSKSDKEREKEMLEEFRTRQLRFPYPFAFKTVSDWDLAMAYGEINRSEKKDRETTILACHYIKAYAFNLDERNPRVRDFDKIVSWCDKHQVSLYLNLMAENVQYADSLVGEELVYLMRSNRDYLKQRYNRGNCTVVDNLEAVNGSDFIDQNWTTEHYRCKGRLRIARHVAESMRRQFGNN